MPQRNEVRYNSHLPPSSIEVAASRMDVLVERIQIINAQVGNRDPIDPRTGEAWIPEARRVWEQCALGATRSAVKELRFLKRWVAAERARYNGKTINVDFDDPKSLTHAAYVLLQSIWHRGVERNEEEKKLIQLLYEYLQHK